MNSALYYSNYCKGSKNLLEKLNKANIKNINFICIDNRFENQVNGVNQTFIVLNDGKKVLLPPGVIKVPSLVLAENNQILIGSQIYQHYLPNYTNSIQELKHDDPSPCALQLETLNMFGVSSDNFSFLDQSSDELLAKGGGGMRQLYSYATIDHIDKSINIPQEEDISSNRIGDINLEELQQQRNLELPSLNSNSLVK
tara:strand:- start:627 stop:1220 length:594 start_codon:yes stop_codon:yes gene_type:complete